MILILLVILQVLYWCWVTRMRKEEPKMVSGCLPIIGHAHKIFGNSVKLWNNFKDLSYECLRSDHALFFLIGTQKFYVLTDPDDIYKVSNACIQKDTEVGELIKKLFGEGLAFADLSTWKKHRKIILPTFNQKILDSFLPIFNDQARSLLKRFQKECENGPFDHMYYLRLNSLEAVCKSTMGVEINQDKSSEYIKAYDKAVDNGMTKYQKFWLRFDFIYNLTNLKKQQDNCINAVRSMTDIVLSKKRQTLKLNDKSDDDNTINKNEKLIFLDQLLVSEELSDKAIKEELHSMLIAGSDTSSNVLLYALILIGSYPRVQKRLYDELQNIFGDSDRDVLKENLIHLTYLDAVLKETMRYYVIIPFIVRYIDKEIKLKNCTLLPGNNCFFSLYGVHRHEIWGEDADQFRPERWIENKIPFNCNAFTAFSLGKRNCIGRTYAMMLMKTTLVHFIRRYKIRADHRQMKLKLDVLLKPVSGHYISIENRENF